MQENDKASRTALTGNNIASFPIASLASNGDNKLILCTSFEAFVQTLHKTSRHCQLLKHNGRMYFLCSRLSCIFLDHIAVYVIIIAMPCCEIRGDHTSLEPRAVRARPQMPHHMATSRAKHYTASSSTSEYSVCTNDSQKSRHCQLLKYIGRMYFLSGHLLCSFLNHDVCTVCNHKTIAILRDPRRSYLSCRER